MENQIDNVEMKREDLAALFAPKAKEARKQKAKREPKYFQATWTEALLKRAILLRYGTLTLPAKPVMSYK